LFEDWNRKPKGIGAGQVKGCRLTCQTVDYAFLISIKCPAKVLLRHHGLSNLALLLITPKFNTSHTASHSK
jgi:hypothetical protein